MPFATFSAGPYTATYNADGAVGSPPGKGAGERDLGLVEGVRRWIRLYEAHPVGTSTLGATVIDGVYRGGQCFVRMTFKDWSPAVRDALWPLGASFGKVGTVGRLLSDLAGRLTLTAAPDTPAAANGPAVLRFDKAIIAPSQQTEIVLGDAERDIEVTFRCFPFVDAAGDLAWFEEE